MRSRSPHGALAACAALCLAAPSAFALVLPPGFTSDNVVPATAFSVPTAMAFLPGGRMLVAEKSGRVWAVANGTRSAAPLWDGGTEVLNKDDRGLLGLAVDPNYTANHYIYLLYTVDPDSDGVDNNDDGFGRLTRYTVSFTDSNTVDYATRKVLMGATWPEGPVSDSPSHAEGDLQFGADGSLFVSTGDGAGYDSADAGGRDPDLYQPGRTSPVEDIGAFRAQYIGSLAGKILRIDPETGQGYPDNPFWNADGRSVQSRIWCYGLRNPFRFTVRPGSGSPQAGDHQPGTLFIGDVGWNTWEEQNIARQGGLNFGWPCYEGTAPQPAYQAAHPIHHDCDSLGLGDNTGILTSPVIYYPHSAWTPSTPPGMIGNTALGGRFYTGHIYPTLYHGCYFFADYGKQWIKYAVVDANDHVVSVSDFADLATGPVDLAADPASGDLFYVAIYTGQIRRIRWTGAVAGNTPPTAAASAAPLWGSVPLQVRFSSAGSRDPDLDYLVYSWDFGDGSSATLQNPTHTYTRSGTFPAVLTVEDGHGGLARDTVSVTAIGGVGSFPITPVLDSFDRPDGPLGPSWTSDVAGAGVRSNSAAWTCCDVRAVRNNGGFSSDQEAFCTLSLAKIASEGLLLKVQQGDWRKGSIEVRYDAPADRIMVSTYDPIAGFVERGAFPVTCVAGDRLGARAWSIGGVELFRNGAPIGACPLGDWPFAASPGSIGFVMRGLPGRIDDFGGGSILEDNPPTAAIVSPSDHSFCVEGDTLTFRARASDPDQSPLTLHYDWRVDLHHGTHVHPATYVAQGMLTTYLIPHHDDSNGVWYEIFLHVTDSFGLADTSRVAVYPEVDLRPGPVSLTSSLLAELRFMIHNDGRMIAPTSRWRLVGDEVLLGEGDVTIPGLDSVAVSVPFPAGALAPGDHTLRLVVDTLGVVVETHENNNSVTQPITVRGGPGRGAVPFEERPRALALSHAYPSPAAGRVALSLALPEAARVEFTVHDLQGRRVWGGGSRTIEPGRVELAWDGSTDAGGTAPPGIYLAHVTIDGVVMVRRIARLR